MFQEVIYRIEYIVITSHNTLKFVCVNVSVSGLFCLTGVARLSSSLSRQWMLKSEPLTSEGSHARDRSPAWVVVEPVRGGA